MNDGSADGWMHRALCLEAEISSRSAAENHYRQLVEDLEDQLRAEKAKVARLEGILAFRGFPETVPARPTGD